MELAYRAFDKSGREVTDTIAATNTAEATDQLRARGLYVADISPVGGKSASGRKPSRFTGGRTRKLKDLAMFTRQL
ncbi:MAG TPA: type II secretion system F family protein, partial [Phycisphaerae bacterium]|nr:type II secretion system F family protein [Phycisphaerae bacterium]